jgi:hypothetical protein
MVTYQQSFPICFQHRIVISVTASSREKPYIEYTLMTSPIYTYIYIYIYIYIYMNAVFLTIKDLAEQFF